MEVRLVEFQQLRSEIRTQIELIERLKQFHLSTKPMFFHRDSWNQTNDMLIILERQAHDTMRASNIMIGVNGYGYGDGRYTMVRQV